MSGVRETIADPAMLSIVTPGVIGPFFIVMYAVQALVGIVAQPFIMGVCWAGRTEIDGRFGFMFGNILKRICTIAWTLTALAAYDLTRTPVQDGEVVERPCTMPLGVEPPQRNMLLKFAGLEIPMPSTTSWLGFAAGWVCVALLVVGFLLIVRW